MLTVPRLVGQPGVLLPGGHVQRLRVGPRPGHGLLLCLLRGDDGIVVVIVGGLQMDLLESGLGFNWNFLAEKWLEIRFFLF